MFVWPLFDMVAEEQQFKPQLSSDSVDLLPLVKEKDKEKYPLLIEGDLNSFEGEFSINSSLLSYSTSFSSMDSFTISSGDETTLTTRTESESIILSRMESDSGLSGRTFFVHLPKEDQIIRDSATEEQLARVRKEIEELELKSVTNAGEKGKNRKELVKVPLEEGLSVALHPRETGKEDDEVLSTTAKRTTLSVAEGNGGLFSDSSNISETENDQKIFGGMKIVDENHHNYILMYDMLTGIRTSVSRCQAKPSRPVTYKDFHSTHKMAFDLTGSEDTPSSRYDFKFKDYAPWVFRALREQFSIDAADYLVSLTGKYVLSELYSPGKSGSLFYYSQDYRFIIKTIRESEHLFLRKILRHYHQHIQDNPNSLLVRFYGLHRVQIPTENKIYFVVMGNLFPNTRPMRSIYDLKGSTHGRWNSELDSSASPNNTVNNENRKGPGPIVLKDLNWLSRREKLVLGSIKATKLMNQLKIDCKFLAKLKIMDYSLLIGLHTLPESDRSQLSQPSHLFEFYKDFDGFRSSFADNSNGPEVYYLGIIDILTPYSMSKKLEHTFKSLVFPKDSISAVNPTNYARRFLKFMSDNILRDVGADYSRKGLPRLPELVENPSDSDFICIDSGSE